MIILHKKFSFSKPDRTLQDTEHKSEQVTDSWGLKDYTLKSSISYRLSTVHTL